MVKNKKGKKKNKMAGRVRPGTEPTQETEEVKILTVASDTSETEDPVDVSKNSSQPTTSDPEILACDSGIDSGRGSPGDEQGSTVTVGDRKTKCETGPIGEVAEETEDEVVREADSRTDTNLRTETKGSPKSDKGSSPKTDNKASPRSDNKVSPRTDNKLSPRTDRKLSPKTIDDKVQSRTDTSKLQKTKLEREVQIKVEDKVAAKPNETKVADRVEKKTDNRSDAATNVSAPRRTGGAVSLKPERPVDDIKHPLEFPWEFWLFRQDVPWNEALTPCATFETVEDFWTNFNVLKNPRAADKPIFLFKKGIRPEWEDFRNQRGGRWNLLHGLQGRNAEEVWQELALMLIGGIHFGELTPHLNGIYCAWKVDGMHFSVWIDTVDEYIASTIGNTIQRCLRSLLSKPFPMELMHTHSRGKKRPIITLK